MLQRLVLLFLAISQGNLVFCRNANNPHGIEHTGRNPYYRDVVDYYKAIDAQHATVLAQTVGATDTDDSLLVVYYTNDGVFNLKQWKNEGRIIVFINNGIHPGEPDGIVASMQLLWDLVGGSTRISNNIVLAIIPVFNISGASKLRVHTRASQNGPELTGFRGNAQNLDLNRDFVKADARETRCLIRLFQHLQPDVLIDNHVSNGADYQHVMTLLSTQHNKLGGPMGTYLHTVFEPALYAEMSNKGIPMVPYVNVWHGTPEQGWDCFVETPRFLSGYAAVFNTFAFVPETHMLKPFPDRVKATYELMTSIIAYAGTNSRQIQECRQRQQQWIQDLDSLPVAWSVDTSNADWVNMKGYKGIFMPSNVSGQPRLYYDRAKLFDKQVPYRGQCKTAINTDIPEAYIIPQGWNRVIQRLKLNGVEIRKVERDTTILLTVYYIKDYQTTPAPYEGHYLHSKVKAEARRLYMDIRKGDYWIPVEQAAKRYIVETLQPDGPDGFFAWGFFDAVLQQKEWYSDYAFEDIAPILLSKDKQLADKLEKRRKEDATFARDGAAQLEFVFQNSAYHEPEHMRHPVYRLE